ncbi:unnamed protein product [Ceratitis capitata]|uniref:(Mediterranean fruit fly) hypothetical protein n=1 Tax=Ceratitis capitata TaxID=7213 RepID=A0A811UYC0_CERCA|nr:unnamed protein product [Ceratitis capitata]
MASRASTACQYKRTQTTTTSTRDDNDEAWKPIPLPSLRKTTNICHITASQRICEFVDRTTILVTKQLAAQQQYQQQQH